MLWLNYFMNKLHESMGLTMMRSDISNFENSLDPDRLASQDPHCFHAAGLSVK